MENRRPVHELEREIEEAFQQFDKGGNGRISMKELRSMMGQLGERLTDDELENMMKEADLNGDGQIDFKGEITFVETYGNLKCLWNKVFAHDFLMTLERLVNNTIYYFDRIFKISCRNIQYFYLIWKITQKVTSLHNAFSISLVDLKISQNIAHKWPGY